MQNIVQIHNKTNMRKVIAAINMTLDGICDHTAGIADEQLHCHYTDLINNSGGILYGRITYQLMQFWQTLLQNPSGEKSMDDFAMAIDKIQKIVFSHTIKDTSWKSATMVSQSPEEVVSALKKTTRKEHTDRKPEPDYPTA